MTYNNDKKKKVTQIIEDYNKSVERFVVESIVKAATVAMDDNKTPEEVADAAFDYAFNGYSGDPLIATACPQVCSKTILYFMRADIIKALK